MAVKNDFQIDPRVAIAFDAMTPSQKAALQPVLRDKQKFLAQASLTGRKVSATKSLYKMRAGQGLRVFYTQVGDDVFVLDVFRKATIDRLGKKSVKRAGKTTVDRDGIEIPKA